MDRGICGGGSGGADHAVVNKFMLKFRPIAPKPVINGDTPITSLETSHPKRSIAHKKSPKRRYVRSRKNNIGRPSSRKSTGKLSRRKKEDGLPIKEREKEDKIRFTPETAGEEHKVDSRMLLSLPSPTSSVSGQEKRPLLPMNNSINGISQAHEQYSDMLLSMDSHGAINPIQFFSFHGLDRGIKERPPCFGSSFPDHQCPSYGSSDILDLNFQLLFPPKDQPAMMRDSGVFGPRVVMETISFDCHGSTDPLELGVTDSDIMKNLGLDTSPGFVSDSSTKIRWVNGAFRNMVITATGDNCHWPPILPVEAATVLIVNDMMPAWYRAFSGQVRVKLRQDHYQRRGTVHGNLSDQKGYCKWQQVVPCDAWRMDHGGFAWRLDLKAALTLGR